MIFVCYFYIYMYVYTVRVGFSQPTISTIDFIVHYDRLDLGYILH